MPNIKSNYKLIKCPFFHQEMDKVENKVLYPAITCENIADGVEHTKLVFKSKQKRAEWEKKYCNSVFNYKNCPLAKIVEEKYT